MLLPQMIAIAVEKFDQDHGIDDAIRVGETYRFPDGAVRDIDPRNMMLPPPSDDIERQNRIIGYWQSAVEVAERDYIERKTFLLNHPAIATDPDAGEQLAQLKAMRNAIIDARRRLAEAQTELQELDPRLGFYQPTDEEQELLLASSVQEAEAQAAFAELIREIDDGLPSADDE